MLDIGDPRFVDVVVAGVVLTGACSNYVGGGGG